MLHNCLAHEHPVKRISMENRKPGQIQSRFFIKWKRIDIVLLSLCVGTNFAGASGSGSLLRECLMAISQVETELR